MPDGPPSVEAHSAGIRKKITARIKPTPPPLSDNVSQQFKPDRSSSEEPGKIEAIKKALGREQKADAPEPVNLKDLNWEAKQKALGWKPDRTKSERGSNPIATKITLARFNHDIGNVDKDYFHLDDTLRRLHTLGVSTITTEYIQPTGHRSEDYVPRTIKKTQIPLKNGDRVYVETNDHGYPTNAPTTEASYVDQDFRTITEPNGGDNTERGREELRNSLQQIAHALENRE